MHPRMGKDFREYRREQIDRDPGYADVVAETQFEGDMWQSPSPSCAKV